MLSVVSIVTSAVLISLVAVGSWWLATARLEGIDVKRTQLVSERSTVFARKDLKRPSRIVEDWAKLRNGLTVVLEALVVVGAAAMAVAVAVTPSIPVYAKVAIGATLVVGCLLVARALYVRLGLYHPALETVAKYQRSLKDAVDEAVATDFTELHASLSSARGEGVDEVTVGVLAAAKNESDLGQIATWGEEVGIADADEFEARARTLAEADLIENEDGKLRVGEPLEGADEDQMATVAASVLN